MDKYYLKYYLPNLRRYVYHNNLTLSEAQILSWKKLQKGIISEIRPHKSKKHTEMSLLSVNG